MTLRISFIFIVPILLLSACGGDSKNYYLMEKPIDIVSSERDMSFDGQITRFSYVLDEHARSVIVIDKRTDRIVDTDPNPDFNDNAIPVGGKPVALAVSDRSEAPRIFVADAYNNLLFAYDAIPPTKSHPTVLSHTPVSLGGNPLGRAGRPLFRDTGAASSPVFDRVSVNAAKARNENWQLEYYKDSASYKVTGSLAGIQSHRAKEGTPYTSDSGEITFTIVAGGTPTTKGDLFEFATVVANPMTLSGVPVDLEIDDETLYVLTIDPPQVITMDLETLEVTQTLALVDPGAGEVVPSGLVLASQKIYISNLAEDNFFQADPSDGTVLLLSPGVRSRGIGYDPPTQTLYFLPVFKQTLVPWDLLSGTLLSEFALTDYGFSFFPYMKNDISYALVPTAVGGTDVINTVERKRVDTNVTDRTPQSKAFNYEFFDLLPVSAPNLVAVATKDRKTQAERWQLVYEGVVNGSTGLQVEIVGDLLTSTDASFQNTLGIKEGDLVVLGPYGSQEEVAVEGVISETELQLAQTPTVQGNQTIEIRSAGSYVVVGTRSGPQKGRVTEGISYTSDNQEISLTIRPSAVQPTTRGDYFTFLTTDGIEGIGGSQKRLARKALAFTTPGRAELIGYVIHEGSGVVTVLNLETLREWRTIP